MQRSSGSLPQPRFVLKGPRNTGKMFGIVCGGNAGLYPMRPPGTTARKMSLRWPHTPSALGHRVPAPSSSKPRACGLPGLLSHLVTSRHISLAPLHRRLYEVLSFLQQMLGEHFRTVNSGIKREPRDGLVQPCVLQTRDPELWSVVCFGKFLSPVI